MQDKLAAANQWFDSRSKREQWLISGIVIVALYQFLMLYLVDYQFARMDSATAQFNKTQLEVQQVNLSIQQVASQIQADPNIKLRKRIEREKKVITERRNEIKQVTRELIAPKDMVRLLGQILSEDYLSLSQLTTVGSRPLVVSQSGQATATQVYRHDFIIEFTGPYLSAMRYLQALERLPWRFYWKAVSYEVAEYPSGLMRIELFTLSLSPDWIGV